MARIGEKVRQPPGGNTNDIFGTQTPPLNTQVTPLFKSKTKSIHSSQDTQDRLFGSEKTSTTRKIKDYLKSSIFNNDDRTPSSTPVKPSTRKETYRNPITGLILETKDHLSETLSDKHDGSSMETGNLSGNVASNGNVEGLEAVPITELEISETKEESKQEENEIDKKSKQFSSNISEDISIYSSACDTSINYNEEKNEVDVTNMVDTQDLRENKKESIIDLKNDSKIHDINDGVKIENAEITNPKIGGHKIDKCSTSRDIDSNELSKTLNESLSIQNSKCDNVKSTPISTSTNGTPNNSTAKTPTIVRVRQPPGGRSLGIF